MPESEHAMSTTLLVTQAFGPYQVNDQIVVDDGIASTLLKTYTGRLQFVSSTSGSSGSGSGGGGSPGGGSSSAGLTLSDVDTEIASAFVARGVPPNTTVPALITQAIAAQGTGSGVSAAQSLVNSLIFG